MNTDRDILRCSKCKKTYTGGAFIINGKIVCDSCYESMCSEWEAYGL
ncbi:MAG: hypothetical protein GF317_13665 [Candidatus Lokiarchaeota archaeon]|nr:hypothetical protein [Candidatus Lokiarchaeota archaeon]